MACIVMNFRSTGAAEIGHQRELPRMFGLTRRGSHGHHATKRRAVHNRLHDPQRITKRHQIIRPLRQRSKLRRAIITTTIATMIQVNHLRRIGQRSEVRLVTRMIRAGAAV